MLEPTLSGESSAPGAMGGENKYAGTGSKSA